MIMKPFERGVNFFIEGYLHDVVAHHRVESQTFYLRAFCYRSLRKSKPPHKLRLAISTKQPNFDGTGIVLHLCGWISRVLQPCCRVDISSFTFFHDQSQSNPRQLG